MLLKATTFVVGAIKNSDYSNSASRMMLRAAALAARDGFAKRSYWISISVSALFAASLSPNSVVSS